MTVDEIIRCPKRIARKKPVNLKEEHRHLRADIDLDCESAPYKMTMFLRRLRESPEDFSVGLRLDSPCELFDYAVVLVRFQGPHGGQAKDLNYNELHNDYHIHAYTDEDRRRHRKKASYRGEAEFDCFEGAVIGLLEFCNIVDDNGIFDEMKERLMQTRLDID